MPQRKKIATIIVSRLGRRLDPYVQQMGEESKTGSYEVPDEDDMAMDGLELAAQSFLRAIDDRNLAAMVKALKNFIYLCEEVGQDDEMEF